VIKVMIVEDEPAAMHYITSLIQTRCSGLEIVAKAEDGVEAIEILKNTQVDILITDVQMTQMNGIELAHWVSSSMPDMITLIISGHSDFNYAKGAIQAGVVEYLLKPINPSAFVETMEELYKKACIKLRSKREQWLRKATAGAPNKGAFPGLDPDDTLTLGVVILGTGSKRIDRSQSGTPSFENTENDVAATYINRKNEVCFALPTGVDVIKPDELVGKIAGGASYHTALYKIVSAKDGDLLRDMLRAVGTMITPGLSQVTEFRGAILESAERRGDGGKLVGDIEAYIREHLDEPLPVQRICDLFDISTSYLGQLFRKHVKMSFVEYITSLRIEEAKRILTEHPDMPVKDVATQVGFSDQFYFSKVFRASTGIPPSEYVAKI